MAVSEQRLPIDSLILIAIESGNTKFSDIQNFLHDYSVFYHEKYIRSRIYDLISEGEIKRIKSDSQDLRMFNYVLCE